MSTAAPVAAGKTSFGGLKDQDRIFQNIYGFHDLSIKVGEQQILQIKQAGLPCCPIGAMGVRYVQRYAAS
jgi:hypothetical protein